jgi:hypothetical protein
VDADRTLYGEGAAHPTAEIILNLIDAYAKFGAKPENRLRALSAIASDGAMVLSCTTPQFVRPARGILRYEDRLSRDADDANGKALLGEHLTRARDEQLPVRMVVVSSTTGNTGKSTRSFHVREDLVGKVTLFDGDHFIVDFTRPVLAAAVAPGRR